MSGIKITLGLKGLCSIFKPLFTLVLTLLLISLLAACVAPAAITQAPVSSAPPNTTTAPTSSAVTAKPQGELVAAVSGFGSENFLPWRADSGAAQIINLVYDMLIYWDHGNRKFIPGLAESWEVTPDALTLTYHLRKGVQFTDGWGELTSADVQYYFQRMAGNDSIGWKADCKNIANMETPDSYTLVIHFKNPAPSFITTFSPGNSGGSQGICCKKYIETVGDSVALQKPIGTGPYKIIDSKLGSYYKFEAADTHWRVVPEFKILILRMVAETSTIIAMLKTYETDLATNISAEQLSGLKAVGIGTEVSTMGDVIMSTWGGIAIPEDSRYDPSYHNKDPWTDVRVRKAMAISIDREAICKAIFDGYADPAGVPLMSSNMGKYQYPYDPAAARQLLKDAGYPNGFTFRLISYTISGISETPRLVEAIASYWQAIGLNPKITAMEYAAYGALRLQMKTAGDISVMRISGAADMLNRISINMIPNGAIPYFEDEMSYALWKEGNSKVNMEERLAYVDKLNQYYFDNNGPIPLITTSICYAYNSNKIGPWPHGSPTPLYLEYVRHAQPLNTFRLFTPWPER